MGWSPSKPAAITVDTDNSAGTAVDRAFNVCVLGY
jgi:hypothetical protein